LRDLSLATLKSLGVPGGIVLLVAIVMAYSGWFTLPLPALTFLFYCLIAGGMLLAWRFHSSRIFFSLLVLLLAHQATTLSMEQPPYIPATLHAIAVLVPTNFVLIALMRERGFTLESVAPLALFLFVQSLTATVFCGAAPRARSLPPIFVVPRYAMVVIAAVVIFLCVRFLLHRRPIESALLWSLGGLFLALRYAPSPRVSTLYWATSACILVASIIESSYLLAYHDELTTLPSRRAFNDALEQLRSPYSIAVVDIDHFKRFNDTYGHDTGDQVLRLVAANLGRVTGGGQAFRCGGEEFTILFRGKTIPEIRPHLEELRETIASSGFRTRGKERRQVPRGPDRRTEQARARSRKGDRIRQLTEAPASVLSVTVSIGVATATTQRPHPEAVLDAADKALYRAKANGRNRVEVAASLVRRMRTKAAGIA